LVFYFLCARFFFKLFFYKNNLLTLLIELRGLRGGGGTAQRNKKGPSTWTAYGPSAHRAWRSWNKGTAKRDFERRLNEMRRMQENDVERMEREITEELEKKDPDEAKILRLWDGLAVLKQQAEDRRQEQEQEDKDGVEYDYLEVLRGLKSEEPRDDDHNVRVKVTNQKHGVEFCFWVKGDAKMEVVVEKIKRVMGIPEHLLKMGVCGKELDASDAWHPVSVFWSVKEGTKELDVVVLFPIKLKGGGKGVKDTKGKKADERKEKMMMADIRESASAVHTMAKIDKDVAELKRKLKLFTDEVNKDAKPLERILGETGVGPLTMLLADVSSTNNTDQRLGYITKIVFAEAAHIEEKAESLTEVCNVAQATVGLAYQKEFATGRGGGNVSGFIPRVRAMIEEKSGVKTDRKKKAILQILHATLEIPVFNL